MTTLDPARDRGAPQPTLVEFLIRHALLPREFMSQIYYYKVTSTESHGKSDGVESPVNQFTTPGPGERIVAYPPQPAQPR